MMHSKQHITDLACICLKKGIDSVVVSPGSRNAPLIKAFFELFGDNCISMADERSAAYFALGMAVCSHKPVVLLCTSGTAALNYAPALAEAYYQQVPLLAITADRPGEWIDQQENQTIRQPGMYRNYIKGSYNLPQAVHSGDDILYAQRIVNEAINLSVSPSPGPVHVNVPLSEPLYEELPPPSDMIRIIQDMKTDIAITLPDELVSEWNAAKRIMIIHGQDVPDSVVSGLLPSFQNDGRIIILAENISNVFCESILSNSNLVFSNTRSGKPEYPDLVIHSGGQVVSKALTGYLRKGPRVSCWRLGTDNGIVDTFNLVNRTIKLPPSIVYRTLLNHIGSTASTYRSEWIEAAANVARLTNKILLQAPFSDLRVFSMVLASLPSGTNLFLGNSSVIRYSQMFPSVPSLHYYSNRGVSGIDGCLSAASGIARKSNMPTLAIVGDMSFYYDSNALWNRELPSNLRILVINNSGGGIFHILKGPSGQPYFKKLVEAHHPVNIRNLVRAYGLDYFIAEEESSLEQQWGQFINNRKRTAVLEVKTDATVSASVYRQMMTGAS
jgi:2-succinyl-5-enolpyruvyl-6-hydroxy-3-cyclohexene-1-carboxylate synthase